MEKLHTIIFLLSNRYFFGVCTLNKMQVCPLHTVPLARYIILSTRYPSPSAPRPANTSQKSSSETFTRFMNSFISSQAGTHTRCIPTHYKQQSSEQ